MVSVFPIRRRYSLGESGYFKGFTDWHCHIIPGVDDGLQSEGDLNSVLRSYGRLGIKEVWMTPHIMEDIPNETLTLKKHFTLIDIDYEGSLTLRLGAENMMDHTLYDRLQQNDLLPIGESGLLVETSYFTPPILFHETLERIVDMGYTPVLAHPERYVYMGEADYRQLKDEGVCLQLNLPSLGGYYGKLAQHKAGELLRLGLYDLAGTDLHTVEMLPKLASLKVSKTKLASLEQLKENRV